MDSKTFELTTSIGLGSDSFELKVSVDNFHNQSQLTANREQQPHCWLSYRLFGQVYQSETFGSPAQSFTPMVHSFRIRSSLLELGDHFRDKKNSMLRVHVCTIGQVLGTAVVDLSPLFGTQGKSHCCEGRMTHGEYIVRPTSNEGGGNASKARPATLLMTLCLDKESSPNNKVYQSDNQQPSSSAKCSPFSSQTDMIDTNVNVVDPASFCQRELENNHFLLPRQKLLQEREQELKAKEAQIYTREREVYVSIADLEKKRYEWEQWRQQEEVKWHEKLRNKEAATIRTIEERLCTIEKDRLRSLETSRSEYEKLEGKLRKALAEVEAKERQLKEVEITQRNEQKRKMAELDLREKLMKEELKHMIEIEASSRVEVLMQLLWFSLTLQQCRSLEVSGKKIKLLEDEIDEIREKHRKTPEVTLLQQLAQVKGQLADTERRIEMMKSEKVEILLEKEQFRASVNRLAKALRREKGKACAKSENAWHQQQIRLSYDANDKSFVLGGRQDEVQRILSDLSKITQIQEHGLTSPSGKNDNQQQCSDDVRSMPINVPPPKPSPQPSHPSCASPTPSINGNSVAGWVHPALDFSQLMSTPS
ncbi:hypothetical protein HJC23_010676 [Cyclotella cryptica]|uniref:DUF3668 domain-containing protein n=1 Tax=Cyclotella cryptica TaxID=29204 RepID=A0ABD3PJF8_9STRA